MTWVPARQATSDLAVVRVQVPRQRGVGCGTVELEILSGTGWGAHVQSHRPTAAVAHQTWQAPAQHHACTRCRLGLSPNRLSVRQKMQEEIDRFPGGMCGATVHCLKNPQGKYAQLRLSFKPPRARRVSTQRCDFDSIYHSSARPPDLLQKYSDLQVFMDRLGASAHNATSRPRITSI